MTGNTDLSRALETLNRKLETLDTLTEANSFLVRALRDHEHELKQMSEQDTLDMLRKKARAEYRGETASGANSKALDVIENALGSGQSAQIIPFPKRD